MTGRILAGRYELGDLLGRGGMGEVWSALDLLIKRRVAVKLLRVGADDAESGLFLREARTAGGVDHPGVVTVHDVGRDPADGSLYLVMEHVEGRDLARVLREDGPSAIPVAADRVAQVAAALAAAHDAGVVHRDLKPANLMLTPEGAVKVLDFGIARHVAATQQSTNIVGTLAYMPPERVRGTPGDALGDLYSLGCVLYELLTGRKPFDTGEPMALMYAHLRTTPEPPSRVRPDIPPALDALVLRMLAKKPADRPRDAGEVVRLLRPFADGADTAAVTGPTPAPTREVTRRHAVFAGLGVVGIVGAGATVVRMLGDRPTGDDTGNGPNGNGPSSSGGGNASGAPSAPTGPATWRYGIERRIGTAPTIVGDTAYITGDDYHVHAVDTTTGRRRWSFDTEGLLEPLLVAGGLVHVVGYIDKLYTLDAMTGEKRWEYPTDQVHCKPIVAGGVLYAGGRKTERVYALDAATGQLRWEFPMGNGVSDPLVTWKGVVYVASLDETLYALDADNGAKIWSFDPPGTGPFAPAVADGRVLFAGRTAEGRPQLFALAYADGARQWAAGTTGVPLAQMVLADSTAYYTGVDLERDEILYAFDTSTGHTEWEQLVGTDILTGVTSDNNRTLYTCSAGGVVTALDGRTGATRWKITPGGALSAPVAVAGGLVYTGSEDHTVYALDAGTGAVRWAHRTSGGIKTSPVVANGAVYVATEDGGLYALNAKTGQGPGGS